MKCSIHIYLLNALYSQTLADEQHEGKESADNRKYQWEDELKITTQVKEISEHRNVSFPLQGETPDGNAFSYDVTKMMLLQIQSEDAPDVFIGASESIIESFKVEKEEDRFVVRLFINDDEPYANPIPGIYIASKEFPKELAL